MSNLAKKQKQMDELLEYCNKIYAKGYSPGTSGNISVREGNVILITSTGCCLGDVKKENIVTVDLNNDQYCGDKAPSSELLFHKAIYMARCDINAIVHAHPAKSTALAVGHISLNVPLNVEFVNILGSAPLVPYSLPGSKKLADKIGYYSKHYNALLLANHGVITLGKSVKEAFCNLEFLELQAEIYFLTLMLPDGPHPLSEDDLKELLLLKK